MCEKCYNCGKKEEIKNGVSNIEKIETELKQYSNVEEKYMPLCEECSKKYEEGKLEGIEEKWMTEKNKSEYSSFESGISVCNECDKELPIGMSYYSVDVTRVKEDSDGNIEVLEADSMFTFCEDCFKKMEVVVKTKP